MGILRFLPLFLTLSLSCAVQAGGLLGGIVDQLVPGLGTSMDDVNRQLKDKIDPYKRMN
ncbi:hypothetical protein [Pseudomonas sp. RIT-PI-S]|uniref:hypothetical protein n=1 Tax=Pseudomonas sp. RIT-PI-S TaxID=3035295 RepID=UPI0021D8391C|nr:hypothetical protein [Pseudomonas sp. RIT-PI-S]